MINFTSKTRYYISSNPTDMRNGRDGLAGIVQCKCVAYNMPPKKESQKVDADHSTTHDNEKTDEVPET